MASLWSLSRSSKGLRLPGTFLLRDRAWVLQVSDLVHAFPVSSTTTPQCLLQSYSRSLHGMSFSGFSNLNGFFLLDDDELDPEELRELDRLGMLRLLLLPNVPIIPLLLDELIELFSDCTTATVVVPTTDLVVVTQEVEAVVSVVVAMVTVAQLSETEVWGKEPVERDLIGASATTLSAPDTTVFLSAGS